jgi:hypothetical protein
MASRERCVSKRAQRAAPLRCYVLAAAEPHIIDVECAFECGAARADFDANFMHLG